MMARTGHRVLAPAAVLALIVSLLLPRFGSVGGYSAGGAGSALAARPALHPLGMVPVSFEPNRGQFDRRVRFVARMGGETIFLTTHGAVFSLPQGKTRQVAVRLQPVGAAPVQPRGLSRLPGTVNYFIGHQRWTRIPTYSRVVYPNIYPHTDLAFTGSAGRLAYDWVLHPGASPSTIRLRVTGATGLRIDAQGNLVVAAHGIVLRQGRPVSYQQEAHGRTAVAAHYVLSGLHGVRLALGRYDRSRSVIVDPPVLVFSTYLGGSGLETVPSMTLDSARNIYLTSGTASDNFPVVGTSRTLAGGADMFVTKLNSTGTKILYSTYIGGSLSDSGEGIAVDAAGDAYVTGITYSTDFPRAGAGSLQHFGDADVVVLKLDPSGGTLLYVEVYGDTGDDEGQAIVLDAQDNAYITGESDGHAFVAGFTQAGGFLGATLLNSNGEDVGFSIARDASNNLWITGDTTATSVPGNTGLQSTYGGGAHDAFVAKFAAGSLAQQSFTYLGGSDWDVGWAIATDSSNNIYVAGYTSTSNFPTKDPYHPCGDTPQDAFLVKLNPSATAMTYGTCLGGTASGEGLAVDSRGEAIVVGETVSPTFPVSNAIQPTYGGGQTDGFVTKINAAGSGPVYSTFLGGSDTDLAQRVAVDPAGDVYIAGVTASTDFPIVSSPTGGGALQPTNQGSFDEFVAEISESVVPPPALPTATATSAPTLRPTATATNTALPAATATPTQAPLATATNTPVPPTATVTSAPAPTATRVPRRTPTATATTVPAPDPPQITLKPAKQVTSGGKLKVMVTTVAGASVVVTIEVTKSKQVLYKLGFSGTAGATGGFHKAHVITYAPSKPTRAEISVTVSDAGGDAVNSASVTILPKKVQ
jgi:hypothetical protein